MSILAKAPTFRPFTLALIQLGQIGASKPDNLRHARDMVLKAAAGGASGKKPDVIVLPVRPFEPCPRLTTIDSCLFKGMLQLSIRREFLSRVC
jgi:hypothetical protein